MRALDLFAGTGWGVACQRLGIEEYGVEIMPEARATRTAAGMHTVFADVWEGLRDPSLVPHYEVGIASPPCQTFSAAGTGAGRRALDEVLRLVAEGAYRLPGDGLRRAAEGAGMDDRTALVLAPLAYFWRDRPTFIALEQVPAVLPVWASYAEVLEGIGYSVAYANLHAEMYGVPQTRKRAILVARRDGQEARLPTPTHSKYYPRDPKRLDEGVLPWVSMAEALGMGLRSRPSPTITGGGTETGGAEPIAKLRRYTDSGDWQPRGWGLTARPAVAVGNAVGRGLVGGSGAKASIVAAMEAGEFVASPHGKGTSYGEQTRITVSEAAVLQSYPDAFPFQGTKGKQFLQVGNAVPPLLAEAILHTLTSERAN